MPSLRRTLDDVREGEALLVRKAHEVRGRFGHAAVEAPLQARRSAQNVSTSILRTSNRLPRSTGTRGL